MSIPARRQAPSSRPFGRLLAVLGLVAVAACGGADGTSAPQPLASLVFSPAVDTLYEGTSIALTPLLTDRRGKALSAATVTWRSSDSSVVTVSTDGVASARRVGTADITATAGGRAASLRLVVRPVPVASLTFDDVPASVTAGSMVQLTATPRDSAGGALRGRTVGYRTSTPAVAAVSITGLLTALSAGEATITAESEGRTASVVVRVVVVPVASIELIPSSLTLAAGQSAQLSAVARDAAGNALSGHPVTFRVTNGLIASVTPSGLVTAIAPGTGAVVAETEGKVATAPLTVTAAAAPAPSPQPDAVPPPPLTGGSGDGSYDIRVRWVGTPDSRASSVVSAVVDRWRRVISGDLPNVAVDFAADDCYEGQPTSTESVDDLLVFVRVTHIDGANGTLARAGPCLVRGSGTALPVVGVVELDSTDLSRNSDLVQAVLTHEFGHVLGIGTLWEWRGLLHGGDGDDPLFLGATARDAYDAIGGGGELVPVENTGGEGTRNGHWRETVFRNELMTGWISYGTNPLSAMTIASLRDLGYAVNMGAADAYALPSASVASASVAGTTAVPIADELIRPRFYVDESGRTRPLP
ncbi:MAG TPA: Ig-like domain-containing protein, partial [Gemmatimonadaceae bacterium]|nr:Ig-like domain-containing protein [Gemmatimonadaceae bacterium]